VEQASQKKKSKSDPTRSAMNEVLSLVPPKLHQRIT